MLCKMWSIYFSIPTGLSPFFTLETGNSFHAIHMDGYGIVRIPINNLSTCQEAFRPPKGYI